MQNYQAMMEQSLNTDTEPKKPDTGNGPLKLAQQQRQTVAEDFSILFPFWSRQLHASKC